MRFPVHLFAVATAFRSRIEVEDFDAILAGEQLVNNDVQMSSNGMPGVEPGCQCSDDGIVNGVDTGKVGCAQHFGRRFGYLCYIEGGEECASAKKGRTGVFYRPCPAERKRDAAKKKLLESLEGIDAELVQEMLENAQAAHVEEDVLKDAEERIGQIGEMLEVRDDLLKALEGFDKEKLKNLAEQAEELELYEFMDHDIPTQIEERIEFLESKDKREKNVEKAIKGIDLPKLQKAIKAAIAVQADDSVVQAGKKREAELINQRKQIKEDLLRAIDGWDVAELKDLAEEAEDHDLYDELQSNVPDRINQRVDFLKSVGKKEATLRKAMKGVDPQNLQDAIDAVFAVRGNSELVKNAMKRKQELLAEMSQARKDLDKALKGVDFEELQQAVAEAKRLNIFTKADRRFARGRTKLHKAMEGADAEKLQDAIEAISAVGGNPELVKNAKTRKQELLAELSKGRKALDKALKGFDLDALRQAMEEAKQLDIVTKEDRKTAKGRTKYLEAIADGDSLRKLMRTIKKYEASGEYPDITKFAHQRVKKLRNIMHRQKQKVKRLSKSGTDPEEIERELAEGLRMRAFGKDVKKAAEKRIAELRR